MSMRGCLGVGLAAIVVFAGAASAQTAGFNPERTRDGRPDLQGFWSSNVATTLERPEGVTSLVVTPEKAGELVAKFNDPGEKVYDPDADQPLTKVSQLLEVRGELRSSLIIEPANGLLPLTALGKAVQTRAREAYRVGYDNPEERPLGERCVGGPGDPPALYYGDLIPSQIVQIPNAFVIATESQKPARIIDMTGRAPPDAIRTRDGYSAGRWEGDTLVVETDHLTSDDPVGVQFRDSAPVSRASRIVERFQLISVDELLYRFTIEDPALYAGPWIAEVVLKRGSGPIYEYGCHEGNYAMPHILLAGRLGRQKPDKPKAPAKALAVKPKPADTPN
jgi:hypothetical protein